MHRPIRTTIPKLRHLGWALALACAIPITSVVPRGPALATPSREVILDEASGPVAAPAAASLAERSVAVRGWGLPDTLRPLQRLARAPSGYIAFCQLNPQDCAGVRRRGATETEAPVRLDADRLAELDAVNRKVNAAVHPITDLKLYGRVEEWTYPRRARLRLASARGPAEGSAEGSTKGLVQTIETLAGDCEDYVLLKRAQLLALGWPANALLITVVRDLEGLGHAVLTARTDRGDIILDNQAEDLAHWKATGYAFIKRQSARDPNLWVSLGTPVRPTTVVGNTD